MVARINAVAFQGIELRAVDVQLSNGLPAFNIVRHIKFLFFLLVVFLFNLRAYGFDDVSNVSASYEGKSVPMDFGAFADLFYFSGDRLYVGKWGCSRGENVELIVYDRMTLFMLNKIKISDCADEQQDHIESIISDENNIYLSVQYRYEQEGRPNFFILDKKSLKVMSEVFIPTGVGILFHEKDKFITCIYEECEELDLSTFSKKVRPDLHSISKGRRSYKDQKVLSYSDKGIRIVTPNYFVSWAHPIQTIEVELRSTGKRRKIRFRAEAYGYEFYPVEGRDFLITLHKLGQTKPTELGMVNLETGKIDVLAVLDTGKGAMSHVSIAIEGEYIFVGTRTDLLVYNIATLKQIAFVKDFIREGSLYNSNGLDENEIIRLIVDNGHLIALTFTGQKSRVINIQEFRK